MIFETPTWLILEDAYITLIILSCIVGIETGIIVSLATRVGSLRKLVRLAMTTTSHKKTDKKKDITTNEI